MVVDINTDFLINTKITADQYLLMSLVLADKQTILKDYCLVNNVTAEKILEDIAALHNKGLIEGFLMGSYDFKNIKPTAYLKQLFNGDDLFKEFLEAFPLKVIRTDGTVDYLRTDQSKARMLYLANTRGKKSIHDHILKCLKQEVKYRESNGSLPFMKRMTSWLNSSEWESYEDQIDDLGSIAHKGEEVVYGTELL